MKATHCQPKAKKHNPEYLNTKQLMYELAVVLLGKNLRDGLRVPIRVRVYKTRSNARNYVNVWTCDKEGVVRAALAYAGGYGYHRPSAALQQALEDAGFALSERIDGAGQNAMREAISAVAELLKYTNFFIHESS